MPVINGRFYMNPGYGRALERAWLREEGAENDEPEVVSAAETDGADGHWVTIDHRHVLIHDHAQTAAHAREPIKVSVSVLKEPQVVTNLSLGKRKVSGVGAQLRIEILDANGKPLIGAAVTESNEQGGLQNKSEIKTGTDGSIDDWIMRGGPSATMPGTPALLRGYVNSHPITVTSTQTLTISSDAQSYQVTWTRVLTNIVPGGKLSTARNKHGVNFSVSWTKPVIRTLR